MPALWRRLTAAGITLTVLAGPAFAADQDGDGLTDADEIALGLDPLDPDSDCDNLDDAVEVGARLDAPRDFDNDGRPNALESHFSDADGDGQSDAVDPDNAVQIGCGGFRPFAITSGETSTVTLRVSGAPSQVELLGWGVPSLLVDGGPVDSLELFDDGSHGDLRAADGVFTRSGIGVADGPEGLADYGLTDVRVTHAGGEETLQLAVRQGITLMLGWVGPELVQPVTQLTSRFGYQSHVVNYVNSLRSLEIRGWLGPSGGLIPTTEAFFRHAGSDVDFLFVFPDSPAPFGAAGRSVAARRDFTGVGAAPFDFSTFYGSGGQLRATVARTLTSNGPTLHELAHLWASYLDPNLGFGHAVNDNHWGMMGAGRGQLGGFDPASFIDHGGNEYSAGRFGLFANGGDGPLYSWLELYTMGLAAPDEVPEMIRPIRPGSLTCNIERCSWESDGFHVVTIADVIASHGPRTPAFGEAPASFSAGFVVVSRQPLGDAELSFINVQAERFGEASGQAGVRSFEQATRGRGQMETLVNPTTMVALEADVALGSALLLTPEARTWQVTITNEGPAPAVRASIKLSGDMELVDPLVDAGALDPARGIWTSTCSRWETVRC